MWCVVLFLIYLVDFGKVFSEDALIMSVSLDDNDNKTYMPFADQEIKSYNVDQRHDKIYFKCQQNTTDFYRLYWQDNFGTKSRKYYAKSIELTTYPGPDVVNTQLRVTCVALYEDKNISTTMILKRTGNIPDSKMPYENKHTMKTQKDCQLTGPFPNRTDEEHNVMLCIKYKCNNPKCERNVFYLDKNEIKNKGDNIMTIILAAIAAAITLAAAVVVFFRFKKRQKALNDRVVYCEIDVPASSNPPPPQQPIAYATIIGVMEPKNKNPAPNNVQATYSTVTNRPNIQC